MIKIVTQLIVFFAVFLPALSFAQVSDEKKNLIDELIELQGTEFIGMELAQTLEAELRVYALRSGIELDEEFFEIIQSVVSEVVYEEFVLSGELARLSYKSWGEQFDEKELKQLVQFHGSSLGQSLISKSRIVEETNLLGLLEFQDRIQPILQKRFESRLGRAGYNLDELSRDSVGSGKHAGPSKAELTALEKGTCESIDSNETPLPVYRGSPVYPNVARLFGIEGWVELLFTINPSGGTEDITVTNASVGTIFNSAAIAAVSSYKYCKGTALTGQKIRIRFELEGNQKSKTSPSMSKEKRYSFLESARFLSIIQEYAGYDVHKAIYVASDDGGAYAYGVQFNHRTEEQANSNAMAKCEKYRLKQSVINKCEPLMIGQQLSPIFERFEKLNASVNSLYDGSYKELSHFETYVDSYKAQKGSKALAIAETKDGIYYLRDSFRWPSQEEANADALKNCQEKKPETIQGECRLYMVDNYLIDDLPKLNSMRGLWEGVLADRKVTVHPELSESVDFYVSLNNCGDYPIISSRVDQSDGYTELNRVFTVSEKAGNIVLSSVVDGGDWVETQNWTLVELSQQRAHINRNRMVSNVNLDIDATNRSFGFMGNGMLEKVKDGCRSLRQP